MPITSTIVGTQDISMNEKDENACIVEFIFFLKYSFIIDLAAPGLNCRMWSLVS